MAAIVLTRLRMQLAALMDLYQQPSRFLRELRDLLEFYDDRAFRRAQTGQIEPLTPHYHVPIQVIRYLQIELERLIKFAPQSSLSLADVLWKDEVLEVRQLGVFIISRMPVSPSPITESAGGELSRQVVERILSWARPEEEFEALKSLLVDGTRRLRQERPEQWTALASDWLSSEAVAIQAMGLRGLSALVEDAEFENLPVIFRLISPLAQNIRPGTPALFHELSGVLAALGRRTPTETVFFLRQMLPIAAQPVFPRLVRRLMPLFTPEQQVGLKASLLEAARHKTPDF